jgi:hypothetical protein
MVRRDEEKAKRNMGQGKVKKVKESKTKQDEAVVTIYHFDSAFHIQRTVSKN